jgi:aminopeptidase N
VARYGPYPFPQLRLAEVHSRALRAAGFALPGVIYLAEDRAFLTDASDPARIDLVTKRVAHEVAHQWWGHQLDPAPGPGSTALVETLARHTELRVLADRHGAAALPPVLEYELDRYLTGRAAGDEVPLVEVGDQAYLYYAKGSLVMAGLVELLGEEAVDGALRDLLREAAATGRAPTSRDLLAHLLGATPVEHRELVREAWTRIVLYDLGVTAARAEREPDGRWRVDVSVAAEKTDGTDGREVTLPVDAELRVTVYAAHPGPGRDGAPVLYSAPHRVSAATALSLFVDRRPAYVAIDPGPLRIDRNRADDLRRIDGRL